VHASWCDGDGGPFERVRTPIDLGLMRILRDIRKNGRTVESVD